jgi:choline kinase
LQQTDQELPKCLLRFGGMTLLERHLRMLKSSGVRRWCWRWAFATIWLAAELDRLAWQPRPQIVLNPQFELGSVLTVHTIAEAMTRGGDVLVDGCRRACTTSASARRCWRAAARSTGC